jgi:hypothetical protein
MIRMVRTHAGYAMHEIVCDSNGVPVSSFPAVIQGMTRQDTIQYLGDVIEAAKLPAIRLNEIRTAH